ncbi:chemotaxis protein CheW [Bacillus sp. M6-12]|uniref:chemotaxis protein CheW n=1 Tax=Bacillus sp. M6-12 TaxID=2054166 RepID=UPI000C75AE56|nr:chemotaxis protein CheW [Bacillus sp. M6-12]PLS15341.1 chemotaxis protein CheW [Bacillus sp. M6-12]
MSEIMKVVVFSTGSEEYALPIDSVLSIEKPAAVTPIPHFPNHVEGMVKIRDQLIPLVSLEKVLYPARPADFQTENKWIILKTDKLSVGIIVKDAKEILEIDAGLIKQLGLLAYHKTSFFIGVANLGSRLITIIDPDKLINSLEGIRELREYMELADRQN